MCFIIDDFDHIDGQIAVEDIICYKIMWKSIRDGVYMYKSLLYGTRWKLLNSTIRSRYVRDQEDCSRQLYGSVVHAYQYLTSHIRKVSLMDDVSVIRCIIPKGTRYWVNNKNEIAATQIKLIEEVNFWNFP